MKLEIDTHEFLPNERLFLMVEHGLTDADERDTGNDSVDVEGICNKEVVGMFNMADINVEFALREQVDDEEKVDVKKRCDGGEKDHENEFGGEMGDNVGCNSLEKEDINVLIGLTEGEYSDNPVSQQVLLIFG